MTAISIRPLAREEEGPRTATLAETLSLRPVVVSDQPGPSRLPKSMPRSAVLLATVNPGSNMWGELKHWFYISRVKSGSHWLLWDCAEAQEADYGTPYYGEIRAWCDKSTCPDRKEAASAMLNAWFREANSAWEMFEGVSKVSEGLLSAIEVHRILARSRDTNLVDDKRK